MQGGRIECRDVRTKTEETVTGELRKKLQEFSFLILPMASFTTADRRSLPSFFYFKKMRTLLLAFLYVYTAQVTSPFC
jgi:hypothetical protein